MSETDGGQEPDFQAWEDVINAAVKFAERYPERYRTAILEALLEGPRAPVTHMTSEAGPNAASEGEYPPTPKQPASPHRALQRAAAAANVDANNLNRVIHLPEDGVLRLLVPVGGDSKAEKANRAAAVYTFILEHGFGETDVDIEALRTVVEEQGAYDPPNFTRNFRNYPWLLEIGKKGSSQKQYRLSPQGQKAAREILQEILGPE